ncbi:MAG TPA: hypothetical protein PK239_11500 [Chitinophagales bacterium]|nr:hypothetical protein [Chitinophagales bacterium]HRK27894.1 hypothetical protein [Chitinophagales bacterium]
MLFTPHNLPAGLVSFKQNEHAPQFFDVELHHLPIIRQHYHNLECHLVLYPYHRKIVADRYRFYPYEEYVRDLAANHRSVYRPISQKNNKTFGLIFGLLIALVFARFKPDDLFSVESVVSVFGAYLLGKDLWTDMEQFLVRITHNLRLRYTDAYYYYQLERNTTLSQYSFFARRQRYNKQHLLPDKLDFIENSNSQTVRMLFNLQNLPQQTAGEEAAQVLSVKFSEKVLPMLYAEGFMLGVKLSFNRRRGAFDEHFEVFQSLHKLQAGCINEQGEWINNAIFYRQTYSLGRLKYFKLSGVAQHEPLVVCTMQGQQSG